MNNRKSHKGSLSNNLDKRFEITIYSQYESYSNSFVIVTGPLHYHYRYIGKVNDKVYGNDGVTQRSNVHHPCLFHGTTMGVKVLKG
jgi:hypothetical protein